MIVGIILWMRLERHQETQAEMGDKVEPDLHSMFSTNADSVDEVESDHSEQQVDSEPSFSEVVEIQHEDLAYYPKEEKVEEKIEEKVEAQAQEAPRKLTSADLLKRPVKKDASKAVEPVDSTQSTEVESTTFSASTDSIIPSSADRTEMVDEELLEEIVLDEEEEREEEQGFWQKVGRFFRGKRTEIEVFSDDGNLIRPAAIETVALILSSAPGQPFTFKEVLSVAHELDLRVENGGFIQLLTTTHYGDEPMYSIAHLLGDGTFDENLVRHHLDDTTPGLIFFSKIPGPDPHISTIEHLLTGIHHFHSILGGTILDSQQRPMNNDDLIALFHKINKLDSEEWERAYEAYEARKS